MSTTITGKADVVGYIGRPVYDVLNEYGSGILNSVLYPHKGKQVRVTVDACEEMKVHYNGKDYIIRVFTDYMEIIYPKDGGEYILTHTRGDLFSATSNSEYNKAQFAIHHMQELLDNLEGS
jgi:hypothetical protein